MFSSVSGFHHRGGDPYETGSDTPIPNFIASVSPLLSRVCSGLKNVRSNPADAGRNRSILIYCSTTALRSQEKPQANHGFAAKKRLLCCGALESVKRSRARQEKCFATAGASGFPLARKVTEGAHPFGISGDRLQVRANLFGAANLHGFHLPRRCRSCH